MVIDRELPPALVDSAKLGLLKLEHIIEEGIFALPKVYYLKCTDGTVVAKAKGYSGKLTREQYWSLINEKSIIRTPHLTSIVNLYNLPYYTVLESTKVTYIASSIDILNIYRIQHFINNLNN